MVISKMKDIPLCNIFVSGKLLKQVERYNYLGTVISSNGKCLDEIRTRIAIAKTAFSKMKNILTNKKISLEVRKRVLKCYIEPVLLYVYESWKINKEAEKHLLAVDL